MILKGEFGAGSAILVDSDNGELVVRQKQII